MDKNERMIRYSMRLAYLRQLKDAKLLNDAEYALIKNKLQKDYHIPSDILADYEKDEVR